MLYIHSGHFDRGDADYDGGEVDDDCDVADDGGGDVDDNGWAKQPLIHAARAEWQGGWLDGSKEHESQIR